MIRIKDLGRNWWFRNGWCLVLTPRWLGSCVYCVLKAKGHVAMDLLVGQLLKLRRDVLLMPWEVPHQVKPRPQGVGANTRLDDARSRDSSQISGVWLNCWCFFLTSLSRGTKPTGSHQRHQCSLRLEGSLDNCASDTNAITIASFRDRYILSQRGWLGQFVHCGLFQQLFLKKFNTHDSYYILIYTHIFWTVINNNNNDNK